MRAALLLVCVLLPATAAAVPSLRHRAHTLNGIDVLEAEGFRPLQGMRLGLVTNQTGRDLSGRLTLDVLHRAPNLKLVRVFSPEHGLRGEVDDKVGDSVDPGTGLPVMSLYGERRRPRPQDLTGLDALVFDVQDAGTRFYTYSATLRYLLEAAAPAHLPVFVLDRPNPLGGESVEGPLGDEALTESDRTSFTCPHTLPVRHGMTIGELARMYNAERHIGADLRVIAMRGWQRSLWFDATGQTWVNPSPNLRSPYAELLYPGVGLLEATNLSVGRGTDRPFEQLGAPWLDGSRLAAAVSVEGARLVPTRFKPLSSKFSGQECGGVQIEVLDRAHLDSVRLGLELAVALHRLYPQAFQLDAVGRLLSDARALRELKAGASAAAVERADRPGLQAFRARRRRFLLYE